MCSQTLKRSIATLIGMRTSQSQTFFTQLNKTLNSFQIQVTMANYLVPLQSCMLPQTPLTNQGHTFERDVEVLNVELEICSEMAGQTVKYQTNSHLVLEKCYRHWILFAKPVFADNATFQNLQITVHGIKQWYVET